MGLATPSDISVRGFDDIEIAWVIDPELATMHVPHREMGRVAARCLIARSLIRTALHP
ncbi:substrate-binding domain-containing protein [Paracoccus sp. EGI L200073]|nr:substrate-binding domain-containing protein [Paracoccus salsus]